MFQRLAMILVGLAVAASAHDTITTKVTWTKEISRLTYKNCASCHREGGSSFSLVTYDEARPWAKAIKEEVLARRMPPWNAVKGFGDFANDKGLTQEQIEIFADWAEGGAPEGNPAYLPKMPRDLGAAPTAPSGTRVVVAGSRKFSSTVTLSGIQPLGVPAGGALQVVAAKPDGSVEPLLWVQSFNPSYNQPYTFRRPLTFPAGTVIQTSPTNGKVSLVLSGASRAVATAKPSN